MSFSGGLALVVGELCHTAAVVAVVPAGLDAVPSVADSEKFETLSRLILTREYLSSPVSVVGPATIVTQDEKAQPDAWFGGRMPYDSKQCSVETANRAVPRWWERHGGGDSTWVRGGIYTCLKNVALSLVWKCLGRNRRTA